MTCPELLVRDWGTRLVECGQDCPDNLSCRCRDGQLINEHKPMWISASSVSRRYGRGAPIEGVLRRMIQRIHSDLIMEA